MSKLAFLAIVAAAIPGSIHAQENPTSFGVWHCVSNPDELFNLSIQDGGVRVNNFSLSEGPDFMSGGAPKIQFSASASNRTTSNAMMSIEVFGVQKLTGQDNSGYNSISFVVSAAPLFGMLSAGKSGDISDSIHTTAGTLAKVEEVCVRASLIP
jgi:hypothetical protein